MLKSDPGSRGAKLRRLLGMTKIESVIPGERQLARDPDPIFPSGNKEEGRVNPVMTIIPRPTLVMVA